MDITPAIPEGRNMIESYGPGRFKLRGTSYQGSLIVFPNALEEWSVRSIDELTVEALESVRQADPAIEILLLGTGGKMVLVPSALRQAIRETGISIDIMDTGAACRTFNVLMTEGRRAAAALIAI